MRVLEPALARVLAEPARQLGRLDLLLHLVDPGVAAQASRCTASWRPSIIASRWVTRASSDAIAVLGELLLGASESHEKVRRTKARPLRRALAPKFLWR